MQKTALPTKLLLVAFQQVAAQQAPAQAPPHLLEPLPLRAKVGHRLLDGPDVLDLGCHAAEKRQGSGRGQGVRGGGATG